MLDKDLRTIKKTYKVPYIAPSTWRQLFLIESNEAYLNEKRVVHDRSSTIPLFLVMLILEFIQVSDILYAK